ncbi:MAG: NUDIX domain-containing protein [Flavobacteriaceae bacterium]|nr:NUDIX domain-containing protein [Flavobacteriaceae bacterium]
MYKVFVNQNVIILTDQSSFEDDLFFFPIKKIKLQHILKLFSKGITNRIYLYHSNPKKLQKHFKKKIDVVQAGGGIVRHEDGNLLFILRKGKWDLPKGKVDKGETIEAAALREVEEETGVQNLKLGKLKQVTYHIFKRGLKYRLKETFWYEMHSDFTKKLVPQTKENITKAVWKNPLEVEKALQNTYPNIKLLLKKSRKTPNLDSH